MNHILYGFIIQLGRSLKTGWCQIVHLRHFFPFSPLSPSRDSIPLGALGYCWSKKLSLNLMCLNSLGRCTFYHFRDRRSLAGRHFLYVHFLLWRRKLFIIILWSDAWLVNWGFPGIFLKIWSEPIILEIIILSSTTLWAALHKIYPIWGIVHSLVNINVENSSSNTTWNLGETLSVDGFRTIYTYPEWNCQWPRYIPALDQGSHLDSTSMLHFNIGSNT